MQGTDQLKRLEKLSPAKRALLLKALSEKATRHLPKPITRRPPQARLPLSYAQSRIWLIDQMNAGSAAYNVPAAIRLKGRVNRLTLEQCLNEVIRRHETLRTSFTSFDGQPEQLIAEVCHLRLPYVDLRMLEGPAREAAALRLAEAEARRLFDLARSPLARTVLVGFATNEHVLLLTMHHIICDGWSDGLFINETALLYKAFSEGTTSPLEELPIQYADYARWQREWLSGDVLEEQLAYWREQLADAPVLELPTDRSRHVAKSSASASLSLVLPLSLSEAINALSRDAEVTLFMTMLAAFTALLSRYSGQTDIVIGTPIAGRTRPETEALIGFFVNTLALRTDVSDDPGFLELLARTKRTALAAYAHQDIPFEKLVEELRPERDSNRTPLFQVMLDVQNARQEPLALPDLSINLIDIETKAAKFDLLLTVAEEQGGALVMAATYDVGLFKAETIGRLLGHWQRLLESAAADPRQTISRLAMLTQAEVEQLRRWNATAADYPRRQCLHEPFETQAARRPDAVAVLCADQQITYGELNRRANQLARHLRRLGVGPEALVGVLMERSVEMVVSLLAILKAGGAYLPLDARYPAERLAFMISDGGSRLLLTQAGLHGLAAAGGAEAVCVEQAWPQVARQSGEDLGRRATAKNLAYVIYTSGSTGKPKGVMITHQSTVALLHWARDYFRAEELAGTLAATSICFDLSVFELFVPLSWGHQVILIEDALRLGQAASAQRVSLVNTVPSAMSELIKEPWLAAGVRTVNLAGEPLSARLVNDIYDRTAAERVVNLYGPTEDTTYSTVAEIRRGQREAVVIGRPIADTEAYILDAQMAPTPVMVAAELYLSGRGLARGYLGRPELTAERFVPNAWGAAGSRLYKTGDLARYLPDGNLEFLGRVDHQVKVRGYRIELGEIEAALGGHVSVRAAAAAVRGENQTDMRIVAYVVADEGAAVDAGELRSYLRERLPEYMAPAVIVQLDQMPLTANGKIDRRSLPEPFQQAQRSDRLSPALRTPIEDGVAEIYASVLGVHRVDLRDDFFKLGGHSLLATQVVSRLNKAFQVNIGLRDLFESPTAGQLAERIEEEMRAAGRHELPPIEPAPRDGHLPLSYSQQRLWFFYKLEPTSPLYNVAVAARLKGPLNIAALEQTLAEIVRRHEVFRTTFAVVDEHPAQIVSESCSLPLPMVDLSGCREDVQEALAARFVRQEPRLHFDLAQEPSLRVRILRISDQDHFILRTMHHIISDGWSVEVFQREVIRLYTAFSSGDPSPLAELPIQYADYARWQRQWLTGEAINEQLAYWTQQLDGAPRVLALPTDYPRPASQTYRGGKEMFLLPARLSKAISELSQQEGVTKFMMLLAAWQVLLYRYTGQERISVGTPIAGRARKELEDLIGLFINTIILHTDLSGDPTFHELLLRVKKVALGAYMRQDVPFEKLVNALEPDRSQGRSPLFQVFFEWTNTPMEVFELPSIKMTMLDFDNRTTLFDLKMVVAEAEEGLIGYIEYNVDLFKAETIGRLLGHWQRLLESAAADPRQTISRLVMLTQAEVEQLRRWNATAADYPRGQRLHEEVEGQAGRRPDAVAVVCDGEHLTYGELNRRANQLARRLVALGVGPEALVAVLLERRLELIVGLMAILKAGGAYMPLDPQYPPERLRFMLSDAGARVLLTQAGLREEVADSGTEVVCVEEWEAVCGESGANLGQRAAADNLAYVIYTSGSTGKPKGVMISHGAIANHMQWMQSSLPLTPDDHVLQKTSISFDASVWELFLPLWAGAQLILAKVGGQRESSYLVEAVAEHQVTILQLVPSMLSVCLEEPAIERCASLRRVYSGGEALTRQVAEKFFQRLGAELHNLYGPTEASIDATYWRCDGGDAAGLVTVPIGKPVSNLQAYVLDRQLQRLPVGVPGELYIGGAGLARGYFQAPEMTASRFIPNPYGDEANARLYQTGDLVRYLPDGAIEYLGRLDDQVKIRGFRIELGEVEAALRAHPEVKQAVVVAHDDAQGRKRLAAYVVPAELGKALSSVDGPLAADNLRDFLKARLPEYMTPSSFVLMESLPQSPNGKIDRRALPALDQAAQQAEPSVALPLTETQRALSRIWADILGVERVGVYDNFFQLGGDSIQSLQIISRARKAGIRFTTRQLFAHPTIAELAEIAGVAQVTPAQGVAALGQTPLTPIQQRFFEQQLVNPNHFNQALLFEVRRPIDALVARQVVTHLLEHHDALRLRFFHTPSGWQARYVGLDDTDCFTVVDLADLPTSEQRQAIEAKAAEAHRSLHITNGPLMRVILFKLPADQPSRLMVVIHHLVVDAVSWRILIDDMDTAYNQLVSGGAVESPPKTTSFKEWAERLQMYASQTALGEELDHWLGIGDEGLLPLPIDASAATEQWPAPTSCACYVTLSGAETRALLRDVPHAYRTQINDALLTALALTLCEWSNCQRVRIDLEGHGREEIIPGVDMTRTVGWFTSVCPLVLRVTKADTIGATLISVKEQLRDVPNRGIGYGLLRYMSGDSEVAERMRGLPRAEVSFNYLGQFDHMIAEDTLFAPASESSGPSVGAEERPWYLLDISGSVENGQLKMEWVYDPQFHRRETVWRLAQRHLEFLRAIIAHCQSAGAGGFTPSDFPLAKLDQETLDNLAASEPQVEDIYPLSPLQKGFLFHTLRAPASGMYFVQMSCKIEADLNIEAFKSAWQRLMDRHAVLRTSFAWRGLDDPLQIVHGGVSLPWDEQDWRGLAAEEVEARLAAYLKEDRSRGFDLSSAPLMRLSLIRLEESVFQFTWSLHHLLMDGWSGPVLVKEALALYEALAHGEELRLPPPRPYSDYIAWLAQQNLSKAEAYWRQTLRGFKAPTPLSVSPERQDLPAQSPDYYRQELRLAEAVTADMQSFARERQLTVNTLVQAAWALWLSRNSGDMDVLFGVVVSGRPEDLIGVEAMVGPFINTLPLRVRIDGREMVLEWLQRLQGQAVEMRQFDYSPLVEIQGWSEAPRGSPLFESFLNFLNYPKLYTQAGEGGRGGVKVLEFRNFERANYPVTVDATLSAELLLEITADCRYFGPQAVGRMLQDLEMILCGLVANPEATLEAFTVKLEEERRRREADAERSLRESRQQKLKAIRRKTVVDHT